MKDTGVIRRIDDLGRIVIPKEIRRNLKIREGDSLEIYVSNDGKIILNKFSPLGEMEIISKVFAESIYKSKGIDVIITDMQNVVASNERLEKKIIGNKITKDLEDIIEKRKGIKTNHELIEGFITDNAYVKPIIVYGDLMGCIILLSKDDNVYDLAEISSLFLSNYIIS